jgi:hypothetical protein
MGCACGPPQRHDDTQAPKTQQSLVVGRLYLDGCLASSGTGTLPSAESQELRLVPTLDPTSQSKEPPSWVTIVVVASSAVVLLLWSLLRALPSIHDFPVLD